jgi:hypothetical protein
MGFSSSIDITRKMEKITSRQNINLLDFFFSEINPSIMVIRIENKFIKPTYSQSIF